jgi:[ribosomal protein S18]-alanine N-acetyltransferase
VPLRGGLVPKSEPRSAGVVLRPAVAADLEAVLAIERVSFSDPPWSRGSFASLLGDARVRFTVACDPTVAGYVVTWVVADEGEIANLAVAPDRRRHGIGRRLLDHAVTEAIAAGARSLYLEVRESNVAARALYGCRGFAAVGRRPSYYKNPVEDALLLRFQTNRAPTSAAL